MARNLATSLRRRACTRPMDRYDRLPPALRAWLAHAALPWSPRSAARLWSRFLAESGGDPVRATRCLDLAERRLLTKDKSRIWGALYPADAPKSEPSSPEMAKTCRADGLRRRL